MLGEADRGAIEEKKKVETDIKKGEKKGRREDEDRCLGRKEKEERKLKEVK